MSMRPLKRLVVAASVAGALIAFHRVAVASDIPHVVTGVILDAADGTSAEGLSWRAWPDADPTIITSGRPGDGVVGAIRPGAFFGDVGVAVGAHAMLPTGTWTVAVEGPKGPPGAVYIGTTRASMSSGVPLAFPPVQLAQVPTPSAAASSDGTRVTVSWTPLRQDGLAAFAVLRSADGATFAEVGRTSGGSLLDEAVPEGTYSYALRAIFAGNVEGLHRSPGSDPVRVELPPDFDRDGVPDASDNCVTFANADQADGDGDGIADACDFVFGDTSPRGAPDGRVDIGDVVRALRFAVGLEAPSPVDLRRGNVAPATVVPGAPDVATPTLAEPVQVGIDDVVLTLRAAVGLTVFSAPR